MASFVMHYIIGEQFLKNISMNKIDENNFRLGNLVVDSIGKENYSKDDKLEYKMVTHFREVSDMNKCVQLPNVDNFTKKYKDLVVNDTSVLGYLFHLYTDRLFFEYLSKNVIKYYDKNMKETNKLSDVLCIKALNSNQIYTLNEFYSGNKMGLYSDYSKMNAYLIDKYKPNFNYEELKEFSNTSFINPGIEEINYNNVIEILNKMNSILKNSKDKKSTDLKIFKKEEIDKLIPLVVDSFNQTYMKKLTKKS